MRLLLENRAPSHEEIVDKLVRDCKPYLINMQVDKKIPRDHLYSGRSGSSHTTPWYEGTVRTNRRPKDTPEWLHDEIDEAMDKKFGIKGRSGVIFCTGQRSIAYGYGSTVYIIIPIRDYKILWSPDIEDLYIQLRNIYADGMNRERHDFEFSKGSEEETINREAYIVRDRIRKDAWDAATIELRQQVEDGDFEFPGPEYQKHLDNVADKYESNMWDQWKQEFYNKTEKGIQKLINTYKKGNILKAIDSGYEIMLDAPNGYYAISWAKEDVWLPVYRYFDKYGLRTVEETLKVVGTVDFNPWAKRTKFKLKG